MKARHKFQENFPNIKFPENSQQLTYNYDKKCHILFVSKTVHYKNKQCVATLWTLVTVRSHVSTVYAAVVHLSIRLSTRKYPYFGDT